MEMSELLKKKKKLFNRAFGEKYALRLLEMEAWPCDQGRNLALVSFDFPSTMSAREIQELCEEIAEWFGGALYGTVDFDFTVGGCSLDMMVEFESDEDVGDTISAGSNLPVSDEKPKDQRIVFGDWTVDEFADRVIAMIESECDLLGFLYDHPLCVRDEFASKEEGEKYEDVKLNHDNDFCRVREILREMKGDKDLLT